MKCESAVGRTGVGRFAVLAVLSMAVFSADARAAQETATRTFEKTLTLGANQTLSLETKFGEVHIHGENGHEAKVAATIRAQAGSQGEANKDADEIKIEVAEDSNGIKVKTVYPDDHVVLRIHKNSSYTVDYDIAVPIDAKLWVRSGFGNTEIRGVQGWADIENSHGQLSSHDSGSTKLVNSFGSVEATGATGNVWIVNNNGPVRVSAIKGALDVKDRFASITVSNIVGQVTISGGNGPVELTDAELSTISNSFGPVTARNIHGNLNVNNSNGQIDVDTVQGSASLNGSFGAVNFRNIAGSVNCTSSNGRVQGGPTGTDTYVKTSFGEVSLEQIGGSLQVEDSNGNISAREVKGKAEFNTSFGSIEASGLRKGVRATTGNGRVSLADVGGEVSVKTSFGSVSVQRVNGNLRIENSNGAVLANSVNGDTTAKTSFASVTLEDVAGSITVDNQNGAVTVSEARTSSGCKSISAKTSFAPLQVRIGEGSNYNVNAKTSFGRISSELPITSSGQMGGDSLSGKIGNGGCTLSLTNANGNIEILKFVK
ncbi:MAG: hypothetical protein WAK20_12970 [Candidatus Acidiferrum sp.]